VPSQALERCDDARNRTEGDNSCGPAAPDDRTQECLQTLDNGLAPAEQNLANVDTSSARPRQMRRTPAAALSSRSFNTCHARARRNAKIALSTRSAPATGSM